MTDQKPILDGFGHDVTKDVGATVTMYGLAPSDLPDQPWVPDVPPIIPPWPPSTTSSKILFGPQGYTLSVVGPNGTVLTVAITQAQWDAIRPGLLEALK